MLARQDRLTPRQPGSRGRESPVAWKDPASVALADLRVYLTWSDLVQLRGRTATMLPCIDLPELLLGVHAWTGFLHAYVHVSGQRPGRTRSTWPGR